MDLKDLKDRKDLKNHKDLKDFKSGGCKVNSVQEACANFITCTKNIFKN